MTQMGRGALGLAALLALTAGYVDAVGFLELGGFFLSFMSGNSTRLGVGVGTSDPAIAARATLLIAMFVFGVFLAALTPERARHRKSWLLCAVALSLGGAALGADSHPVLAGGLAAVAMGALNIVFQRDGEISVGVTYMTGSLVRLGARLAAAFKGGPPWAFAPFLLLWAAMACGAVLGAVSHQLLASGAFWLAAVACLATALIAVVGKLDADT
ncbi:MAG: DUF1275 domain-containing protein [Caulobacterales bacterium]|nr:DUF1275 domain-containing protein [Caulobacterales bacterium]